MKILFASNCNKIAVLEIYFYVKTASPLQKVTTLFTSRPPLKIEILSSPPFLKIWQEAQPLQPTPAERKGVHTMVMLTLLCLIVGGSNCTFLGKVFKIIDNFPPGAFYSPPPSPTPPPRNNQAQKCSRFWPLRGFSLGESVKNL